MVNSTESDLYGHDFLLDHLNHNLDSNLDNNLDNNLNSNLDSNLETNLNPNLSRVDINNINIQNGIQNIDNDHMDNNLRQAPMSTFAFDNIDFAGNLGHNSEAFPPSEYPQNTPALAARNSSGGYLKQDADTAKNGPLSLPSFQSPILPSQNKKSYNHEHLYQKKKQQRSRPNSSVIASQKSSLSGNYTPLVSPAATPLEQSSAGNFVQADFEPLTSPALKAQNQSQGYDRHRPSSTFAGDEYANGNAKRRTPHSTPNLQANAPKLKSTPSQRKVQQFEPLPDSSMDEAKFESETTPMLPPQGKPAMIDSNQAGLQNGANGSYGPGTLMGFTMNRLAEQQGSFPEGSNSTYAAKPTKSFRRDSSSSQRNVDLSRPSEYTPSNGYSSSETSPVLDAQTGYGSRRDRPSRKDTSHKFSEQGRRNRMNQAVFDLSSLIPREYHEQVAIPSKAATLELAATYIRHLLEELDKAKGK